MFPFQRWDLKFIRLLSQLHPIPPRHRNHFVDQHLFETLSPFAPIFLPRVWRHAHTYHHAHTHTHARNFPIGTSSERVPHDGWADLGQILLHGGYRGDQGDPPRHVGHRGIVAGHVAHGKPGACHLHGVVGLSLAVELQRVQSNNPGASVSVFLRVCGGWGWLFFDFFSRRIASVFPFVCNLRFIFLSFPSRDV